MTEPDRADITMHAGYLKLQTHTHTQYVTLIAPPLQQRLHERLSMLRYTVRTVQWLYC